MTLVSSSHHDTVVCGLLMRWQGETVLNVVREWDRNLSVEVHIGDELVYRVQPGPSGSKKGTGAGNVAAIAGKILVARKFGISSMLAALRKEDDPSMAKGLDDSYKVCVCPRARV